MRARNMTGSTSLQTLQPPFRDLRVGVNEFGDEANIAYVAFTRAIRELYLPQDFKNILTPEWQAASSGMKQSRVLKGSTRAGTEVRRQISVLFQALNPANCQQRLHSPGHPAKTLSRSGTGCGPAAVQGPSSRSMVTNIS